MTAHGTAHIGISGWRYKVWRGTFYPPGLRQRMELEFASRQFSTIEINGTHYSLQRPDSFRRWREETPADFVFSVKGSRFITHMRKLREVEQPLSNFFAQGLLALGPKLGPLLWQLPPQLRFDAERLAAFFRLLPRTTTDAAALALEHDPRLKGRCVVEAESDRPLRHALEVRHASFVTPEFIDLLRQHDVGLVVADTVQWPLLFDLTADFVYCRLHGSLELYSSGYEDEALQTWAGRVVQWMQGGEVEDEEPTAQPHGHHASESRPTRPRSRPRAPRTRDVFVYFDNDAKVRAPYDAAALQRRVNALLQPKA